MMEKMGALRTLIRETKLSMGSERRKGFPKDLTLQLKHEGYLGLGLVKSVLGEGEQQGFQVQGVANGKTR